MKPDAELDGFVAAGPVHTGGQSTTHRVTKAGIDRPLMMKQPLVGPYAPPEAVVAFETEAMIVPLLTGPHVPAFVAAGDLSRRPYLVMEWVEGQNLENLVSQGPRPPDEVARLGAAVADALHSLHQQEVLHLDVKPENIILREDGTAVLIDFGFAHHAALPDLLAEEIRLGVGSAPYVSPEQLLGTRSDRRSDLFALGVVLYELLTGKLPFGEPDSDVRNRFWLEPSPPREVVPSTPPWLQEIILRCLEPRAAARYQTAAHVAFDLRHPDQVPLTDRASKAKRTGLIAHVQRFFKARAEHGARLRSPPSLLSSTPIIVVAVDTRHIDDPRHPEIRSAVMQRLSLSKEFRLICVAVIPDSESTLDHMVRLRHWIAPVGLPPTKLSLHAITSHSPADAIVELAHHNNADLVILGAPAEGGRAWAQSVASTVTAQLRCSVHVVRRRKR